MRDAGVRAPDKGCGGCIGLTTKVNALRISNVQTYE